ncbi:hypothetical protein L6R52_15755 [Myxococcota bacterium]|nr:hypothetical protein [Myxococcota bacterium]
MITKRIATKIAAGIAGLVVAVLATPVMAEEELVVEKLQHGEVNWTKKHVIATGSGAPDLKQPNVAAVRLNAERAALVNAYRNVLETLKGVKVTATELGDKNLGDVQVRTQVQGIVQGCKTIDTRYYSDGGVDVVIRCPLDGGLSTVLAPVKDKKAVNTKGDKKYTGLVVDAVGTKAQPAIAPRLLDEGGAELYAREMVTPTVLRNNGAAVYVRSVEAAKKDPRAGSNPLVVKASALGAVASDIVITKDDAAKMAAENLYFLADGQVVIATDGP